MSESPEKAPIVQSRSTEVTLKLALLGILLVVLGNGIEYKISKIDVGSNIAGIGALFLIIGVLQWFFDRDVRSVFFAEIREEILGSTNAANSGIRDFYADSKSVSFDEYFTSSTTLVIGVNYSGKLIDNCIGLLKQRTDKKLKTTIVTIKQGSHAEVFLVKDYETTDVAAGLKKIEGMVKELDPNSECISIVPVETMLRYSFVQFDSRIWIVVGTNGLGRRPVPGFFVSHSTPWYEHFVNDIALLLKRK